VCCTHAARGGGWRWGHGRRRRDGVGRTTVCCDSAGGAATGCGADSRAVCGGGCVCCECAAVNACCGRTVGGLIIAGCLWVRAGNTCCGRTVGALIIAGVHACRHALLWVPWASDSCSPCVVCGCGCSRVCVSWAHLLRMAAAASLPPPLQPLRPFLCVVCGRLRRTFTAGRQEWSTASLQPLPSLSLCGRWVACGADVLFEWGWLRLRHTESRQTGMEHHALP